jgi:hypothetical protein
MVKLEDIRFENDPIKEKMPEKLLTVYKALDGSDITFVSDRFTPENFFIFLFTDKTGGLSKYTYRRLTSLARIRKAIYILNYQGTEHQVEFRKKQPGGAVQMAPADVLDTGGEPVYIGRIFFEKKSRQEYKVKQLLPKLNQNP